jgi:hypothetical protein
MRKFVLLWLLAGLVLLGAAGPVQGQGQTFRVGVQHLEYFPHYTYRNGEFGGYGRAVLDAFAESSGHRFEYVVRPVARLMVEYLQHGRLDFVYPDNPAWDSRLKVGRNVVYSEPVAAFVDGVMVPPDRKGAGVERLTSLGTIRGFTPSAYLDKIQAGSLRLEESNHFSSLLRKAASGRVGGAYINVDVARHFLVNEAQRPDALVFDPALPHVRDSYFLSTVDHPTVIAEFNAFLRNQKHRISALKKRFGIRDEFPEDVALGGEQG